MSSVLQDTAPSSPDAPEHLDVLVVEDEHLSSLIIEKILLMGHHTVVRVASSEAAVEQLHERVFDAVLCDLLLPGIDGLGLCRILRSLPGRERTLFLLLTGVADEARLCEAFQIGVDDALVKPISPNLLLARLSALRRLLRRVETAGTP